eukprot:gene3310-4165_t
MESADSAAAQRKIAAAEADIRREMQKRREQQVADVAADDEDVYDLYICEEESSGEWADGSLWESRLQDIPVIKICEDGDDWLVVDEEGAGSDSDDSNREQDYPEEESEDDDDGDDDDGWDRCAGVGDSHRRSWSSGSEVDIYGGNNEEYSTEVYEYDDAAQPDF